MPRPKRKNNYNPNGRKLTPTGGSRGCLCKDEKTYSRECCNGSLWSQGIGNITAVEE